MIIKTCNSCAGRPYTTDIAVNTCPRCGSFLSMESVEEYELAGRPEIGANTGVQPQPSIPGQPEPATPNTYSNVYDFTGATTPVAEAPQDRNEIVGNVYGYTNSENEGGRYRRLLFTKISDALFYGQRTEDICHRFYVRPERQFDNSHDVPVIVHGTLSAGAGLQDNAMVRVRGKMHKGALYARKITVINNGFESPVKFQVGVLKLIITILSFLFLIAGAALLIFDRDGVNGFFTQVKTFLAIFGIVFLVLFIITTFILSRSRFMLTAGMMGGRGFRGFFIMDLILAVVIAALIFKYLASVGFPTISVLAGTFGPVIILIIGVVLLISCIFR